MPVTQRKEKKGAHHWQRKANPARKAKRARHFVRADAKARRHIRDQNANSETVLEEYDAARLRRISKEAK